MQQLDAIQIQLSPRRPSQGAASGGRGRTPKQRFEHSQSGLACHRAILVLTFALTSTFGGLMAFQGSTPTLLVTGVMWSPGLAAMLTCVILKRSIASLPWRWGQWKWNWYAWALPIVYGLIIYLPVWLFGLGGSGFGNTETLTDWSTQLIGGNEPNLMAAVAFGVILATIGMVSEASRALGEEIGWRGLMYSASSKRLLLPGRNCYSPE